MSTCVFSGESSVPNPVDLCKVTFELSWLYKDYCVCAAKKAHHEKGWKYHSLF